MVLQEIDKSCRGQICARFASRRAIAIFRGLALIDKAFTQCARKKGNGFFAEVAIIAPGFASQEDMQDMMHVVIPLRVKAAAQMAGGVIFILKDQMDLPSRRLISERDRQFG